MGKHWSKSRTIWFNIGTGLVGIGVEFAAVADLLPDEYQPAARLGLAVLVAVGNVILRTITSEPVR